MRGRILGQIHYYRRSNYYVMNKTELNHTAFQRLIIIALGVLAFSVVLQSCQYGKNCAAYDEVDTDTQIEMKVEN